MFKLSVWNAWPLSLLFIVLGMLFMGTKRDIAKRMSDMTGYTRKERASTILASIAPYPFMIATVWIPFSERLPFLYLGILLYVFGMVAFIASLKAIIETPRNELFREGPYRFTRNPLYVSAAIVFLGICLATANIMLVAYLVIATLLQHFMILAEERICKDKYGVTFENYSKKVPRYLFI
jgi:protein-S-isoprenylcysteine O-methyltransferase Ste14